MSPDLVWLTIIANVIIAVVTIANTWALAWYNKRQSESRESPAQHEESKSADRRINRRVIIPATLMFFTSIAGIALSAHTPAVEVTTQILRISGFTAGAVLSIVFILVGYFVSLLHGHVALTSRIAGVVGTIAENTATKSNEP